MSIKTVEATFAIPISLASVWGALPHVLTILSIIWVLVRLAQEPLVQKAAKKFLSAFNIWRP